MFHLKSITNGKSISVGSILGKMFEISYQVYEYNRFDATVSYDPEIDDRVCLSINILNLNLECNLFSNVQAEVPQVSDNEINEVYEFPQTNTDFNEHAAQYEIGQKDDALAKIVSDELHEHGNIAVHHWVGIESGHSEPLGDALLSIGKTVIIRALSGSVYKMELRCDDDGWYFYHPFGSGIIDISFNEERKLWIMSEPIE